MSGGQGSLGISVLSHTCPWASRAETPEGGMVTARNKHRTAAKAGAPGHPGTGWASEPGNRGPPRTAEVALGFVALAFLASEGRKASLLHSWNQTMLTAAGSQQPWS